MKSQFLFSRKNKKNIISLSSAETAHSVVIAKEYPDKYFPISPEKTDVVGYFSSLISQEKHTHMMWVLIGSVSVIHHNLFITRFVITRFCT